jgi:hypothetical protein
LPIISNIEVFPMKLMICYDDTVAAGAALNLASLRAGALNAKIYVVTSIKGGSDVPREEFVRVEKKLERLNILFWKPHARCWQ